MELSRDMPLYDKTLNVRIQSSKLSADAGTKDTVLAFRILQGASHSGQSQERLLHFELTDENDPYFLFLLELTEQDFPNLKRDQSILVDFSAFPAKLIELLLLCQTDPCEISEDDQASTAGARDSISSYAVKLDVTSGLFSIVESNRFKQLTHISLQLRPGNDAAIKAYLASRLAHTTAVHRRTARELSSARDQLSAELSLRRDMADELRELRSNRDLDMHSIRNSHSEEVLIIQSRAAETLEKTRETLQSQLSQLRSSSDIALKASAEKIADIEALLADEKQERVQREYQIRELTRTREVLEIEKGQLSSEATELRQALRTSEIEKGSVDREFVKLQMRLESMGAQQIEKEMHVTRAIELQHAHEEARRTSDEQVVLYRNSLAAVSEKLNVAIEEIKKGNHEIQRQQQECLQAKDRVSAKSEVIRKQEALIVELRSRLTDLERLSQGHQASANDTKNDMALLQRDLEKTKQRLAESASIISTNQEVITWLNREISRYQLSGGIGSLGSDSYNYGSPDTVTAVGRDVHIFPLTSKDTKSQRFQQMAPAAQRPLPEAGFDNKVLASYDYLRKHSGLEGLEGIGIGALSGHGTGLNITGADEGYYAGLFGSEISGIDAPHSIQKSVSTVPMF